MSNQTMQHNIPLSKLIDHVRDELMTPPDPSQKPILYVEEIELEVGVTYSYTADAGLKVNVVFFEMGGEGGQAKENVHTVRLKLTPLLSKEDVLEQLKQDGNWNPEQAMQATVKSSADKSPF